MKVVLLAGGFGTRLSEETHLIPKPMVEIGGFPILWHIMKTYSHYGYNEFVVCLGYKGHIIKEYFANYFLHCNDVTVDLEKNSMEIHQKKAEPWKVTLVDTGPSSLTGGRLLRVKSYTNNQPFMLTYGDGVSNININKLVDFHKNSGRTITVSAVQPDGRFGALDINGDQVTRFLEKPRGEGQFVNGGYFVCQPDVFNYLIHGDQTDFEDHALPALAKDHSLSAYTHQDFWKCMDTLRDKDALNSLWASGNAPWKVWN